jgi:hypothetical protein
MNTQQADHHAGLVEAAMYHVLERHPINRKSARAWLRLLDRIGRMVETLKNVCDSQLPNKSPLKD